MIKLKILINLHHYMTRAARSMVGLLRANLAKGIVGRDMRALRLVDAWFVSPR